MEEDENKNTLDPILVIVVGIAGASYFFLRSRSLDSSAALYVGIPVLLAIALSFTSKAKTIVGGTMKAITIILLLLAPLMGEGFLCIFMAAPIFYLVAFAAALFIQHLKDKKDQSHKSHAMLLLIMLSAMEGTTPELTFNNQHKVTVTQTIALPSEEIKNRLAAPFDFESDRPLFLKIFPLPDQTVNEGIAVGDKITLDFTYNKLFLWNPQQGQMQWQIATVNDQSIRYVPSKDNSYLSNYLTWKSSKVEWKPVDALHTQITWTLAYQRDLDPAWYFSPMQYLATKLTAHTLIENIFKQ